MQMGTIQFRLSTGGELCLLGIFLLTILEPYQLPPSSNLRT
jgi:hypothetical protein